MYIVVYDDRDLVFTAMTWDEECEGALRYAEADDVVALFDSPTCAKRAIDISVALAKLRKAQGAAANDDFLPPYRKNVRVRCCAEQSDPRTVKAYRQYQAQNKKVLKAVAKAAKAPTDNRVKFAAVAE